MYISFSLSGALGFVNNLRTLVCVCICRMLFENWCSGVQNVFAIVLLGSKEMCLHSVKCFYFKGANILQRKYQNRMYQALNPLQQKGKKKLLQVICRTACCRLQLNQTFSYVSASYAVHSSPPTNLVMPTFLAFKRMQYSGFQEPPCLLFFHVCYQNLINLLCLELYFM